jgi:membrane protease YdiL (CAAX protease family)
MQVMMGGVAVALCVLRPFATPHQGCVLDGVIVLLAACTLVGSPWVNTDLASWTAWPVALVAGAALFALSVALTADRKLAYFRRTVNLRSHGASTVIRVAALTPLYEEAVWRIGLQGLLCEALGPGLAIPATALSFVAWHRSSLLGSRWQAAEFLLFSLVLGCVVWATRDPLAPVALHAVRNLLVMGAYTDEAA